MVSDWKSIWENRRHVLADEGVVFSLADLIRLNGFDLGAGGVSERGWLEGVSKAERLLEIGQGQSVLEFGCGAGAFLWALEAKRTLHLAGLDISQELIEVAKLVLPSGEFFRHDLASGGGASGFTKRIRFRGRKQCPALFESR